MSGYNVTIGSTSTNVTVGYRPTLGVTQQASGIVGPQGPTGDSYWTLTSAGIHTLSNVGIGTTNPTAKLTVQGNVLVSGIVTATSFSGNATSATYATNAGVSTYATSSGIATYSTNAGIATYATSAGIATYSTNAGVSTYATSSGIATYSTNAGTSTSVIGGIASVTQLNVSSGITTVGFLTATNVYVSGVTTSNAYLIGATQVISSARQLQNIASLDAITTATIESAIQQAPNDFNSLNVSGISTLQSTTLIGGGTSTGTANQNLQVSGGAYVSGNLGVGNTNPQDTLDVGIGTIRLYNKISSTRFSQIYQDGALNFKNSVIGDDFIFYGASNLLMRLNGSGELVIGTTNLTGTASQPLQVTGGAYVSGNLGIGTTNPTQTLDVRGNLRVTGTIQNASMIAFSVAFSWHH